MNLLPSRFLQGQGTARGSRAGATLRWVPTVPAWPAGVATKPAASDDPTPAGVVTTPAMQGSEMFAAGVAT